MSWLKSVTLVALVLASYYTYNRYSVFPESVAIKAQHTLELISTDEGWNKNRPTAVASLALSSDITSISNRHVLAQGKVMETAEGWCREVEFHFHLDMPESYRITQLEDCYRSPNILAQRMER